MSYAGNNLTLHHENDPWRTAYGGAVPPKELQRVVDRGSISSFKRLGKSAIATPPIDYVVVRKEHQYIKGKIIYIASTRDGRVGSGLGLDDRFNDWPHTVRGRDADTITGAVASFRKSLSEHVLRYTSKTDPTIAITEYEHVPNNDRSKLNAALTLATHVYLVEDSTWGYHYEEVCVGNGRMDVVRTQGSPLVDAYEIKSCRADFTADKKWQQYLPYCHRFSFVTIKGAIAPDELPKEVGLFYLNPKYRPAGELRRHTSEMALVCARRPKMRPTELKHILASLDNMIRKGGPVRLGDDHEERLQANLAEVYGVVDVGGGE